MKASCIQAQSRLQTLRLEAAVSQWLFQVWNILDSAKGISETCNRRIKDLHLYQDTAAAAITLN
jgi:hypothetical protein